MVKVKRKRREKPRRHSAKAGLPPGTMMFIGEQEMNTARVDLIDYNESQLEELRDVSVDRCGKPANSPGVRWINVNGIHNVGLIESLGKSLDLHPLTLEDIVNTTHRPKAEMFPRYIYVVLKMISYDEAENRAEIEHISLVLGENYVVSFQEKEGDVFNMVRERLRTSKGPIRSMKADYLAYTLMDAVVDNYFLAVERIGDRIEELDDRILIKPKPDDLQEVHRLKRDILSLRKAVWPLREEIGALEKSESSLIRSETKLFLRDLYDHTIQIIDMVETFRDVLGSVHDTFLSSMSNRMNEVMKVLTIVATIFIPLTFIAGVYGMNFENMPELKWPWGYFIVLGVMLVTGFGMLGYFWKKKWL
ncbi:magnesium/cobalt transporter CorA [Hydrogenovibrio sp. 3SP14C1]|uniref:magnesium/cobalt transporter CorA n=1 Tax=Hydrogenovibrio sp. 3SP14C1 TaxID=3038774 RepID=UPI002417AC4F|nr:magnesium/cobalt transporter CorA [Hydrogenovibrio sp. 3SP14C1]MDG4812882.1 magnesium/cobalt transporter CorA [Hydrogenovibrio sp. 3SP14C1]